MLGPEWKRAPDSFSNGNCVEVRLADGTVGVRDSKNPNGPALTFTPAVWVRFVGPLGSPRHRIPRIRGLESGGLGVQHNGGGAG